MFIMSGLSHYLASSLPDAHSANYSLPIDSISNSSVWSVGHEPVDVNIEPAEHEADEAHDMAYSAYTQRIKRAAKTSRYSEAVCQRASTKLASLVNIAVTNPGSWYRYKGQIKHLQSIAKSADCKARA